MAIQTFALKPGRINKFKGQILKHALPDECLSRAGRQIRMPQNQSDTYVARRWLPYRAAGTSAEGQNRFFADGTGDRGNLVVQENLLGDGVSPEPESITPLDLTVVIQHYGCVYGFTDKTFYLYEDDVPKAMTEQVGERVTLVNEMICWGQLRGVTNVFYGGTGTSMATVNGPLTLPLVRKVTKNLRANHGRPVTKMLSPSPKFDTSAVQAAFGVYAHTDLEPDIRDLPNFTPAEKYPETALPYEVGKVEGFRFFCSADLVEIQDAGAAVGGLGLQSQSGTLIDVYNLIVLAQDAFSQIALRGMDAMKPTFIPPSQISKSDQLGQRGYVGTSWWKAVLVENHGWMANVMVGITNL